MACAEEVATGDDGGGADLGWCRVDVGGANAKEDKEDKELVPMEEDKEEDNEVPMEGRREGGDGEQVQGEEGAVRCDDWPEFISIGTEKRHRSKEAYHYQKRSVLGEIMYELIKGPKEKNERGSPYSNKDEFLVLRLVGEWWTAYDSLILADGTLWLRQAVWCSKDNILTPGWHRWLCNTVACPGAQEKVRAKWEGTLCCETRVDEGMNEGMTSQLARAERVKGD